MRSHLLVRILVNSIRSSSIAIKVRSLEKNYSLPRKAVFIEFK